MRIDGIRFNNVTKCFEQHTLCPKCGKKVFSCWKLSAYETVCLGIALPFLFGGAHPIEYYKGSVIFGESVKDTKTK